LIYLYNYYSSRIALIIHQLEFDRFISKERRVSLEKELSSLIEVRNKLIKVIEESREQKSND